MIDGLKIEMTSDELFTRLTTRIAFHKDGAAGLEERLRGEDHAGEAHGMDARAPFQVTGDAPRHMLEHARDDHYEQAQFLELLREHLIRGEVYRLDEEDLRVADLTPGATCW